MNQPQQPADRVVRNRRLGRVAIAVVAGGGLALGISGLARAEDPTPAPGASGSASAPAPGGEKGDRAPREHQPHLDGTVKSIADGHILVVDRDGFTRQINFSGTPEGVKVGVRVRTEGTVNADGVSLDATKVEVATAPPAGKGGPRGGHGGPGKGPGRGGAPATPPSGATPPSAGTPSPAATS
ncbi:hypothetical protein ACWKSP_13735 [Micromonosporaceae bacterium Da 78-11]